MKKVFLLFAALALLIGCSDDDKPTSKLKVSPTDLNTFNAVDNSTQLVTVTTSLEWEYDCKSTWVLITPAEKTLTVGVESNPDERDRYADIIITAGTYSKTVKVTQKGATAGQIIFDADPKSHNFTAENPAPLTITVSTNLPAWEPVEDPNNGWATVTKASDGKSFTINATPNPGYTTREATIKVTASGQTDINILVTQSALPAPEIKVSNRWVSIYPKDPVPVTLTVTGDAPNWTAVSSDPTWAVVTEGNGEFTITVTGDNLKVADANKTAIITVSSTAEGVQPVEVNVTQENLWNWLQGSFAGSGVKKFDGDAVNWASVSTDASEGTDYQILFPNFNNNTNYDLYIRYDETTGQLTLNHDRAMLYDGDRTYYGKIGYWSDWKKADDTETATRITVPSQSPLKYDFENNMFYYDALYYNSENGRWPVGLRIWAYYVEGEQKDEYAGRVFGDALYNVKWVKSSTSGADSYSNPMTNKSTTAVNASAE